MKKINNMSNKEINYMENEFIGKKNYCYDYFIKKNCYKKSCSNAHSKDELNIKILENYKFNKDFFIFHFKTELCPWINFNHPLDTCIYAHNYDELRRCYHHNLRSKHCDKLKNKKRCKEDNNCRFVHNLFEFNYHPLVYKNNKCKEIKCKNIACNSYHDISEKRNLKIDYKEYFNFLPNRDLSRNKVTVIKIKLVFCEKSNTNSESEKSN